MSVQGKLTPKSYCHIVDQTTRIRSALTAGALGCTESHVQVGQGDAGDYTYMCYIIAHAVC